MLSTVSRTNNFLLGGVIGVCPLQIGMHGQGGTTDMTVLDGSAAFGMRCIWVSFELS